MDWPGKGYLRGHRQEAGRAHGPALQVGLGLSCFTILIGQRQCQMAFAVFGLSQVFENKYFTDANCRLPEPIALAALDLLYDRMEKQEASWSFTLSRLFLESLRAIHYHLCVLAPGR